MDNFRLLLLSDVHGNSNGIQKLVQARYSQRNKLDALVISGDFPVTTPFKLILQYMIKHKNLSRRGYSTSVYKKELRDRFVKYQIASLTSMMTLLEKFELPLIFIPGNIETFDSVAFLKENFPKMIFLDENFYNFKDAVHFYGLGGSLDHLGVLCDHEFSEQSFNAKIKNLEAKIGLEQSPNEPKPKIFIFHEPPTFFRTKKDLAQLKIKSKKRGYRYTFAKTGGSEELSRLINHYRPILAINGHYHEYPGVRYLNNTAIVNPGAFATYNYAILTISGTKIIPKFYRIRPNFFSFTNFLYQKRSFTSPKTYIHG